LKKSYSPMVVCRDEHLGELAVAELCGLVSGDRLAVADADLSGAEEFSVPGPTLECSVDDHRHDGCAGASTKQAKTWFDRCDPAVGGTRTFRVETDGISAFEFFDDNLDGGDVCLTSADGNRAQ